MMARTGCVATVEDGENCAKAMAQDMCHDSDELPGCEAMAKCNDDDDINISKPNPRPADAQIKQSNDV